MCSVPLSIKPQREQDPNGRWRSASMMEGQPSVGVGGTLVGGGSREGTPADMVNI